MNEIKISKEAYDSEFIYNLRKKELEEVILETKLLNNHLTIQNSYIYYNDGSIEIGIYLINNSNKVLDIKQVPINIYDAEKLIHVMDVDINKVIEPKESIFKEVIFPNDNFNIYNEISVSFGELDKIKKYPYLDIDIKKVPTIGGYKSYRATKKFLKNISSIEENKLVIDIFRSGEIDEGFCIVALLRNSSNKDINIKSIPITVFAGLHLPVYKGVYNINDNGLIIEANKGKFYSIVIPVENFINIPNHDFNKYIVEFK